MYFELLEVHPCNLVHSQDAAPLYPEQRADNTPKRATTWPPTKEARGTKMLGQSLDEITDHTTLIREEDKVTVGKLIRTSLFSFRPLYPKCIPLKLGYLSNLAK